MTLQDALAIANEMAYGDYHINAGINRKAVSKVNPDKSVTIRIDCYTANGKYKGNYKCGSISPDGQYVTSAHDEVDLANKRWIGR